MANTGLGLLGGRFFCIFKYVYKKLAEYGKMSVRLTIIYLHSIHCLSFRLSTKLLTLETFSILVPYPFYVRFDTFFDGIISIF